MTQIQDLIDSNLLFSWSLQKGENDKTRYQYEFTKRLLDMLSDSQEQESEDESSQDKDWSQWDLWEENNQEEWEEWESSSAQNRRDSEYFLSEWEEIQKWSNEKPAVLWKTGTNNSISRGIW